MATNRTLATSELAGMRAEQPAWWLGFLRALWKKPLGMVGAVIILVILFVGITAPLIAPYDPTAVEMDSRLQGPSLSHPIGTDQVGRDILTRLMYGARVSLTISLTAVGVGGTLGALFGILSGYFRGSFDFFMQRFMDMMQAFPLLIMALTIVALLGASTRNVIIAIAIVLVPSYNRLVRGSTLAAVNYPYIEAARSIGATDFRILLRHILPNITAPLIVLMTASFGGAILVETSLTFLGLGASPTEPTWGGMLASEGRSFWEKAPWMAVAPGMAISLAVLGYNLLGDALRDIWDPALRGR